MILTAAHVLGDFLFQNDWLAKRKGQLPYLLLHGLIHALVAYLLYQAWTAWSLPVAIFVVHLAIDATKQRVAPDSARGFLLDQGAHLASLAGIGWLFTEQGWLPEFSGAGYIPMVVAAGFVATVLGAGYFIGKVAGRMKEENDLQIEGLLNGGAMIGNLERALIFLFLFINEPMGIGFLVAAKSILRFEEAKKQKLAEYVLIGTLLSFSTAIAIASATKWALGL